MSAYGGISWRVTHPIIRRSQHDQKRSAATVSIGETKRAISLPKSVLEEFFPPHMSLRSSALSPMRYNSAQNMQNLSWEAVQVFSWSPRTLGDDQEAPSRREKTPRLNRTSKKRERHLCSKSTTIK